MSIAAVQSMDSKTALRDVYRGLVDRFGLFDPTQLGRLVDQLLQAKMIRGKLFCEDV